MDLMDFPNSFAEALLQRRMRWSASSTHTASATLSNVVFHSRAACTSAALARILLKASSKLTSCMLRLCEFAGRRRMRRAVGFDRPTQEQQADDNPESHLFLFSQAVHQDKVIRGRAVHNGRIQAGVTGQ